MIGPLDIVYEIGAPATAAIAATMATLYAVEKWGWGISKPSNGAAGDKSVDYWKTEIRDTVETSVDKTITPILKTQTDILSAIQLTLTKLTTLTESIERRIE